MTPAEVAEKKTISEVREAILRSDLLAKFYEATWPNAQSLPTQSACFLSLSAPITLTYDPDTVIDNMTTLGGIYADLENAIVLKTAAGTAGWLPNYNVVSPSSYPLDMAYVGYLQNAKKNLESRVAELEDTINDFKVYLPTIKRMVEEYNGAALRVQILADNLTAKFGPRSALEMARKLDVLDEPPPESYDDGE